MSPIELVYDYFEDHVRAAAVVGERRPLALGIACYMVGGLSLFVAQALAQKLVLLSFSWTSLALVLLWDLAAGFLLTAVLHLILAMGSVEGSAAGLFVLLGLAELSWSLAVPLVLISRVLAPRSHLAVTAVLFAVGLLSLTLKARGLQDNYRLGAGRAWLTLGLPYLAMAAAAVLAFSLAVIGLILEIVKALD